MAKPLKYPVSALVVLHDSDGNILLIERTSPQGFWQSVTGSIEPDETIEETAKREVWEETGIHLADGQLCNWHDSTVYEIYHHWRHRYPKGVFENREHIFSAEIPRDAAIVLQPDEHVAYGWGLRMVRHRRSGGKSVLPVEQKGDFGIGEKVGEIEPA